MLWVVCHTYNECTLDHDPQHPRTLLQGSCVTGSDCLTAKGEKGGLLKGLKQSAHHQGSQIYHQPIHPLASILALQSCPWYILV